MTGIVILLGLLTLVFLVCMGLMVGEMRKERDSRGRREALARVVDKYSKKQGGGLL